MARRKQLPNPKPNRPDSAEEGKANPYNNKKPTVVIGDRSWLEIGVNITRVVANGIRIYDFIVELIPPSDDG